MCPACCCVPRSATSDFRLNLNLSCSRRVNPVLGDGICICISAVYVSLSSSCGVISVLGTQMAALRTFCDVFFLGLGEIRCLLGIPMSHDQIFFLAKWFGFGFVRCGARCEVSKDKIYNPGQTSRRHATRRAKVGIHCASSLPHSYSCIASGTFIKQHPLDRSLFLFIWAKPEMKRPEGRVLDLGKSSRLE